MKRIYRLRRLSKHELDYYEHTLLEEIDRQSWYGIFSGDLMGQEVFSILQSLR
jgi:hypothetical protein